MVDLDKDIDINNALNTRVALRSDSYTLHKILPTKVDPLVSLMKVITLSLYLFVYCTVLCLLMWMNDYLMRVKILSQVEKVPDSTYDMVGGLDKQILEIKEVIELPIKHPELFDALGVSQLKERCYMAHLVQVRRCRFVQWPITLTVHSSVYPVVNWSRNTLVRVVGWFVNYSSWQEKLHQPLFSWTKLIVSVLHVRREEAEIVKCKEQCLSCWLNLMGSKQRKTSK